MKQSAKHAKRIGELERELAAERRKYNEAKRVEHLEGAARYVYELMMDGLYPIVGAGGRLWWARGGDLLRTLESNELTGLHELRERGIVELESKTLNGG